MEQHLAFLGSLPLFRGMEETEILRLLQGLNASELRFAKQEIIWEPFRRPPYLCVVVEGCFQMMREDWRGNRSITDCFLPGDLISETPALFPPGDLSNESPAEGLLPFYYTVKAGTAAIIFSYDAGFIPPEEALRDVAMVFLRNLADALIRKETRLLYKIEYLSRRTTREKLMSYLMVQAALQGGGRRVTVEFTRQELADFLSVDRSAMCTELARMQKDGLIRFDKREFELLGE